MQRKLAEYKGTASQSVSAPDIGSDHTGRKVSDWTGDIVGEVEMCPEITTAQGPQSHACPAEANEADGEGDSLMTDEQHEVQS